MKAKFQDLVEEKREQIIDCLVRHNGDHLAAIEEIKEKYRTRVFDHCATIVEEVAMVQSPIDPHAIKALVEMADMLHQEIITVAVAMRNPQFAKIVLNYLVDSVMERVEEGIALADELFDEQHQFIEKGVGRA